MLRSLHSLIAGRHKVTWMKGDDGSIMIDCSDAEELLEAHPIGKGNILLTVHTAWLFKPLPPDGNTPQTEVTLVTKVDLKGAIPPSFMRPIAARFLTIGEKRTDNMTVSKCKGPKSHTACFAPFTCFAPRTQFARRTRFAHPCSQSLICERGLTRADKSMLGLGRR